MDFPGGSPGKESACNAGDKGSIPGLGRASGEGKGYLLKYSGLENSMDSPRSRKESDTTEWLSLSNKVKQNIIKFISLSLNMNGFGHFCWWSFRHSTSSTMSFLIVLKASFASCSSLFYFCRESLSFSIYSVYLHTIPISSQYISLPMIHRGAGIFSHRGPNLQIHEKGKGKNGPLWKLAKNADRSSFII